MYPGHCGAGAASRVRRDRLCAVFMTPPRTGAGKRGAPAPGAAGIMAGPGSVRLRACRPQGRFRRQVPAQPDTRSHRRDPRTGGARREPAERPSALQGCVRKGPRRAGAPAPQPRHMSSAESCGLAYGAANQESGQVCIGMGGGQRIHAVTALAPQACTCRGPPHPDLPCSRSPAASRHAGARLGGHRVAGRPMMG